MKQNEDDLAPMETASCSTNSCGSKGMCAGQALFLSFFAGMGITQLTGIQWLLPTVTIGLAIVLITGIWRIPFKKKSA